MTWGAAILTIIKFLPELYELIKSLSGMIKEGIEEAAIKRKLSLVSKAFAETDRKEAARKLNEAFRN